MKYTFVFSCLALSFLLSLSACKKDEGFNLFSVDDDIELGKQLKAEIEANPSEYPLLSETQYSAAYGHLYRMK